MGDEISRSQFENAEFEVFRERLASETALLGQWFEDRAFSMIVRVT